MDAANARPDESDAQVGQAGETGAPAAVRRPPTVPVEWAALEDHALLELSRAADPEAFAELFRRHRATAVRVAARTSARLDPEDVAAEAFARVWTALCRGRGPEQAFRPYLLTTVRNVALNRCRAERELPTDPATLPEPAVELDGFATAIAEAQLIGTAFASLPERWQQALWATEVDGQPMADFARSIGASPNAASALCLRARDGLKSAWLQAHVHRSASDPECEWTLARLGAHARHRLPAGQRKRVEDHLATCDTCPVTLSRLAFIGRSLKVAAVFAGTGGTMLAIRSVAGAGLAAGTVTPLVQRPIDMLAGAASWWMRDGWRDIAGSLRHPAATVARSGARVALATAGAALTALTLAAAATPQTTEVASGEPLSLSQVVASATPPVTAPSAPSQPIAAPASGTPASAPPERARTKSSAASASRPLGGRSEGTPGSGTSSPATSPRPSPSPSATLTPSPTLTPATPTPEEVPTAGATVPATSEPSATEPGFGGTSAEVGPSAPASSSTPVEPGPNPTPPDPTPIPPSPTPSIPPPRPRPPAADPAGQKWPDAPPHWPGWCPFPPPRS